MITEWVKISFIGVLFFGFAAESVERKKGAVRRIKKTISAQQIDLAIEYVFKTGTGNIIREKDKGIVTPAQVEADLKEDGVYPKEFIEMLEKKDVGVLVRLLDEKGYQLKEWKIAEDFIDSIEQQREERKEQLTVQLEQRLKDQLKQRQNDGLLRDRKIKERKFRGHGRRSER